MFDDAELGCRQSLRLATESGSWCAVIMGHVDTTRQPNASALINATNNAGEETELPAPVSHGEAAAELSHAVLAITVQLIADQAAAPS